MIITNTHEAKTHLSRFLRLVSEKHEVVRVCRNGVPVADIVEPCQREARLKPGDKDSLLGEVKIRCDLTEPVLSENELPDWMR